MDLNNDLIDLLAERLAVLDIKGNIISINKAWQDFVQTNALPNKLDSSVIGASYFTVCNYSRFMSDEALLFANGIKSVMEGEAESFEMEYEWHSPNGKKFWFLGSVKRLNTSEGFLVVTHTDITKWKLAERTSNTSNLLLHQETKILTSISDSMAIFLQSHNIEKAVEPILQRVALETRSQFTGLGFLVDNLKLQVITNSGQLIEITKAMGEEVIQKGVNFETSPFDQKLAYLVIKTFSTSSIQIENQALSRSINPLGLEVEQMYRLRNFISIPIKCQEVVTSVLILANKSIAYSSKDLEFLDPVRKALGIIYDSHNHIESEKKLENQQKFSQQELLRRARQQSVLVRLGRQALLEADISKLMDYFIDTIREILTIDCCFILEFDKENTLFLRQESFGLNKELISFDPNSPNFISINSTSLIDTLLSVTGPLIIDDLETDIRFTIPKLFKSQEFVSGVSVVLYINNEVYGFLCAFTRTKRLFTSNEANFLQTIAHTLVTSIKRHQDEEKLLEHLKLIDASHDGIIACDLKEKVVFWSKGASNLYGVSKENSIGMPIASLIGNQDPDLTSHITSIVLKSGQWIGEITSQKSNGDEMVVLSHWTLIYDNFEMPKAFLLVNTDITEKKKLETQFLRAQRMENLGSLASGIAHDLNNLLTPIMLSLDLLKRRADERSMRIIERVESSTKRGSEMVKQILSFAKGIESSQTLISLQNILDELLNIIKVSFPNTIRIYPNCSSKIWPVLANATQIFQILMNLCVNARDAMPEGGLLTITVKNLVLEYSEEFKEIKEPTPFVQISVADSGVGISTELINKIFEPFFTTKQANGTGLGLAMVADIVHAHKGIIRVNSQINKGTTFSIYLPAISDDDIKNALGRDKESLVGNNQSILLVDHEISTLEITKTTLETYNYKVLSTNNGSEAITIYFDQQKHISAVIVDMSVPEIDGAIIITSLKTLDPNVKIIATTSDKNTYSNVDSLSVSVKKIAKPYTAETLLKALKEILSK